MYENKIIADLKGLIILNDYVLISMSRLLVLILWAYCFTSESNVNSAWSLQVGQKAAQKGDVCLNV